MPFLLLLEDDPADLRKASDIARRAGFNELEVHRFSTDAKLYLERAMNTQVPVPDAMLLDLTLGDESGFEVLRYWHSNPRLKSVPVIVWTHADSNQRQICKLFGVQHCVYKDDDPNVLAGALSSLISER
jgi:DNA-binding response OmpR family regulator